MLLGVTVAVAPALSYAQHAGGGGHGGGGAHFGGGGHFAGGAHFAGGGHFTGPAGHFAGGAHYAYGGHAYSGAHFAPGVHGGFARPGFGGVHGGFGYPGRYWGGGYWHGGWWPGMWFNPGWAWFLPILPFGYATYYWGGVPYYYWNDLYYTYSPADSGYVVTQPPPVSGADTSGTDAGATPPADQSGAYEQQYGQAGSPPPAGAAQAAPGTGAPDVYLYPRNHQTDQQMATDRYECHNWAVGQTGFDPTRSAAQSGDQDGYRRAMIACLDARGYSAR